jgi:hypothetical protein
MSQELPEKKIADESYLLKINILVYIGLHSFIEKYGDLFKVYRQNNTNKAYTYLLGLMKREKKSHQLMSGFQTSWPDVIKTQVPKTKHKPFLLKTSKTLKV